MRLILAFAFAIIVPTAFITGWYLYGQFQIFEPDDPYIWVRTSKILVLSLFVSGGFVLVLGLPAYFVLRHFNFVNWWSTIIAGFTLSSVPAAFFSWPLGYSGTRTSSSINGVQTMVNGVPTTAGWVNYLEGILFFGLLGATASFAFWLVVRKRSARPYEKKEKAGN